MRFTWNRSSFFLAIGLTALYAFLSPKIYFRHDDWLMLGNSVVILPKDWNFLWRASWYVEPSLEEVWFFRPWFKLLVWLGYQLFSLESWLWTMTHWITLLLSASFGGLALKGLTASSKSFYFFFNLLLVSLSIHFACVVWMGEGMMNIPQLLFLSLSLWSFVKKTFWGNVFSFLFYFISLGFKESSAFFPFFLFALSFSVGELKRRWKLLVSMGALMASYLIFRLVLLPFNPGYKPHLNLETLFIPLLYFSLILALPLLSFWFTERPSSQALRDLLKRHIAFLPFLGLVVAPHLGHPFFSPGWFLLPGFFGLWIFVFSLSSEKLNQIRTWRILGLILVVSAAPVALKARELRWFEWEKSQKLVQQFIKNLPEKVEEVWIETCPPQDNPALLFERVVGSKGNLEFMRALYSPKPLTIRFISCGGQIRTHFESNKVAFGKWIFPDFLSDLKELN